MKWKKIGLIYVPDGSSFWMKTHAAVPCAFILNNDIYRVLFSTRDDKNCGRIGFVDFNINRPGKILNISRKPLIDLGQLGTFDDSGVMPSDICISGKKIYLYYTGWNICVTVPFRNAIGLAISEDGGYTFKKYSPGPIMDRSIIDPYFIGSVCVRKENNIWKMWYQSCIKWKMSNGKPKHYYLIKYAVSKDAIIWVPTNQVAIPFKYRDEYAICTPRIVKNSKNYQIWYSYRAGPSTKIKTYRIGYAESSNGTSWIRKDTEVGIDVSESGWDSTMIEYPFIFSHQGHKYMLYNGNDYGKTGFGLATLES